MMRVANVVEKNVKAIATIPIVVVANTAKVALIDLSDMQFAGQEFCGRYLFNNCADNLYYCFFSDKCDNVKNWNGYMLPGQQLDCSNHGGIVSVFSVAGGSVVPTLLRRIDLTTQPNNLHAIASI